jgi:molybdopterin synthase catalytic subunit
VSDDQTLVRITAEPLSVDEALAFIADPSSGGSCIFVGTVRDADANGVVVTGLTNESWNYVAVYRLQ